MTEQLNIKDADVITRNRLELESNGVTKVHILTSDAYRIYRVRSLTSLVVNYSRGTLTVCAKDRSGIKFYTYDMSKTRLLFSSRRQNPAVTAAEEFLNQQT